MQRVIVFDVNETLLDLGVLDPHFKNAFGDAGVRREWFSQVLQSALVATILGVYTDFAAIGKTALEMIAAARGAPLSGEQEDNILSNLKKLPPHPEVPQALDLLGKGGLRLAALTNSAPDAAEAHLKNAGLYDYFEQVLSVDLVRRFKPHAAVYRAAAERLKVEAQRIRMVAAHSWDVAGALRAGCAAAFVAREGKALDPLFERPDVVGKDLMVVAEKILEIDGR